MLSEELNFTRTAEKLNYAQSSVTTQIQRLEGEFGVCLFERLGKRVLLTEAGKRLLHYTDAMLKISQEAHTAVAGRLNPTGTLMIGAVESLCTYRLAPILADFRSRYPQVELVFRAGICGDLRKQVTNGNLDLAFTLEKTCQDEHLVFEVLIREKMLVLAHPDHPLAEYRSINAADLNRETIIVTEPGCSYRVMFEEVLASAGLQNTRMEFSSVEAIKQCVIAGLGIALLPEMAVSGEIQQGKLTALPWAGPEFPVITQMCWHKDKWMSPALQSFIGVSRNVLLQTP